MTMFKMDDEWVLCPNCGGLHTHMDVVEIASADGSFLQASASGEDDYARIAVDLKRAPEGVKGQETGRRHVIALYMECEECGKVSRFTFQQHKGVTFGNVSAGMYMSAFYE